jgi:acyl-CoA reductase-like NAD-dependent aldehyde dehydrogenase
VAVVSATGSTAMGRDVGPRLAARFARAILELGGNNAAIVAPRGQADAQKCVTYVGCLKADVTAKGWIALAKPRH